MICPHRPLLRTPIRTLIRTTNGSLKFIDRSLSSQVLIYTADWTGASWRERKFPNFETGKWDSNQGSLDCESGILPLSYRAPHYFRNGLCQHNSNLLLTNISINENRAHFILKTLLSLITRHCIKRMSLIR